jgi:hypothetical protein
MGFGDVVGKEVCFVSVVGKTFVVPWHGVLTIAVRLRLFELRMEKENRIITSKFSIPLF